MSATLINLIIQIIAGVIGGNAVGTGLKEASLGGTGNTIAGALGGIGGGQLLATVIPVIAGPAGGGIDITSIIGQLAGGGIGGAILTAVVGLIVKAVANR
jgi:hypothetical protein